MRAQRACFVAGSVSEVARSVTEGVAAGVRGPAPGNFFEFIKRANYPEKQSGISWQKIKPYFYGLL